MSITRTSFGRLPCGAEADLFILKNASGASVEITNYGGIIRAIRVPDRDGKLDDIVLGHNDVSGYIPSAGYLGALIGRVGNRIKGGKFTLNGVYHQLAKNEGGKNHLHGGERGYDAKLWSATAIEGICEDILMLKIVSVDGDEGYPGTLTALVTYRFTDDNDLSIRYEAVSDKDTLCNLTNHSYFNLAGEKSGKTILDHTIEINADTFTVVDEECIPTGEMRDVAGTPFDLRSAKRIGDEIDADCEQIRFGQGYDHNFNLNDEGLRYAARVSDPASGRTMDVLTDKPAIQFYAGNMLAGVNPGKSGRLYAKREGLCLETQYAPDSINQPSFPDSVLYAGEKYDYTTVFIFGVED
ncbi:MAG: aldose epimerase family protein [Christensenellales bacterium]|jgi:aldose 1-epimerase